MTSVATITHDDGTRALSLAPLAGRLKLPWEYEVLAMVTHPVIPLMTYALVHLHKGEHGEYVVYRVDLNDGSCHGGSYAGQDYARAFKLFGDRFFEITHEINRDLQDALAEAAAKIRHLRVVDGDSK